MSEQVLQGGPDAGVSVQSDCRFYETAVFCTDGMICRAVYERSGSSAYIFAGVDHPFEVAPGQFETRRESPAEWHARTAEGRDYAPTNLGLRP